MENNALLFIGIWIIFVILFVVIVQHFKTKRYKMNRQKTIDSIYNQLTYLQETYIKDPQVHFAYASSNDHMCRATDEKAKALAKNIAKAAIRTTITGRASYRGSDINQRNYLIGYGKETYYFFHLYGSDTAKELSINEDKCFSITKDNIQSITTKDKKNMIIYLDLKDGSRIGFQLKDKILSEVDFTTENENFKNYLFHQTVLQ